MDHTGKKKSLSKCHLMDAVESEVFVLYMIAIAHQHLTAQFNRRDDGKMLVHLLVKNLVLCFLQAYAFGL